MNLAWTSPFPLYTSSSLISLSPAPPSLIPFSFYESQRPRAQDELNYPRLSLHPRLLPHCSSYCRLSLFWAITSLALLFCDNLSSCPVHSPILHTAIHVLPPFFPALDYGMLLYFIIHSGCHLPLLSFSHHMGVPYWGPCPLSLRFLVTAAGSHRSLSTRHEMFHWLMKFTNPCVLLSFAVLWLGKWHCCGRVGTAEARLQHPL